MCQFLFLFLYSFHGQTQFNYRKKVLMQTFSSAKLTSFSENGVEHSVAQLAQKLKDIVSGRVK